MRLITLICCTTAATLAAALPAQAQTPPEGPMHAHPMMGGTMLEVRAEGRTTRVPDMAVIQAGVVSDAPSATAAMAASSTAMARVIAALRGAGVAERDIQTSNVSLNPQYRSDDNRAPVLTGYQASNRVSIRFRDIKKSGSIIDALVKAGANSVDGPSLTLADPDAATDEARQDAVKRARARAELYAAAAGLHVDRIVSMSEIGDIVRPMPMMAARSFAAAPPAPEILPGEQEVTAQLTVRFLLK